MDMTTAVTLGIISACILIAAVAVLVCVLLWRKMEIQSHELIRLKQNLHRKDQELDETHDILRTCKQELDALGRDTGSIERINRRLQRQSDERKQLILAELEHRSSISSSEAADILGVSNRTARRYLSDLQEAGSIEQSSESGPATRYCLPS